MLTTFTAQLFISITMKITIMIRTYRVLHRIQVSRVRFTDFEGNGFICWLVGTSDREQDMGFCCDEGFGGMGW